MSSAGGRPSRQKMVSVGTPIVPPGPCPSPADTPGPSTAATTPQVTASLRDFALSLEQDASQPAPPLVNRGLIARNMIQLLARGSGSQVMSRGAKY